MTNLRVLSNVFISSSTFVLRIERPDVEIRAGQCFSLGTKDLGVNREYSMYSGANSPYLEFLIREIEDGVVSSRLAQCTPGDIIEVAGPFGSFCLDEKATEHTKYVFVASGTGIAPFHSFVQTYRDLDFVIFHGVRYRFEQYGCDEYDSNRYFSAISRADSGSQSLRVTDLLAMANLDTDALYYLCGNQKMIVDAIEILRAQGVPGSAIYTETFF